MYDISRRATICRTVLVWTVLSAATAGLAALTVPLLVTAPEPGFTGLLVRGCSGLALAAGCGLWLLTTEVAWRVIAGGLTARATRGNVLGPVRAVLLAACGVVALTAPAAAVSPSGNDQEPSGAHVLDGLPLPDRAGGVRHSPGPSSTPVRRDTSVLVRADDCLWTLAEERLGPRAGVVEVATYWQRIYALNRDVIGPDPDLILPGQRLQLPSTE